MHSIVQLYESEHVLQILCSIVEILIIHCLAQTCQYIMSLGLNDKEMIDDLENLGPEHEIMKPNLITGQTAFGEFTKAGSQVEMSKTPQSWPDPLLHVPGSCKPEWLTI